VSALPAIELSSCRPAKTGKKLRWAITASILMHTCGLWGLAASYSKLLVLPVHVSASHATETIVLSATAEERTPNEVDALLADSAITILPHRAIMGSHVFHDTPSADVALSELLTEVTLADSLQPPTKIHDSQQLAIPLLAETLNFIEEDLPSEKAVVKTVKPTSQVSDSTAKLTPPDLNGNVLPRYPEQARRLGWQGRVLLRIWINEQGSVTRIKVEESSGYSLLDAAAATSVRTWRVQPAQRNGQPVAGSWLLPIRFRQP
jgi:TonB family protein